ncbi:MAG: hypothetical protein AAF388_15220 [Bacteroidota bacterium]
MKRIIPLFLLVFCIAFGASAQHERVVTIKNIPETNEEFQILRSKLSETPEGSAALFILALHLFQEDDVQGNEALISMLDKDLLIGNLGKYSYNGYGMQVKEFQKIQKQLQKYPYIPASYFPDAKSSNKYAIPPVPFDLVFIKNLYSGSEYAGKVKYFIKSNGAKKIRPISLRRNSKGRWLVTEYGPILARVVPPVKPKPESKEEEEEPSQP